MGPGAMVDSWEPGALDTDVADHPPKIFQIASHNGMVTMHAA